MAVRRTEEVLAKVAVSHVDISQQSGEIPEDVRSSINQAMDDFVELLLQDEFNIFRSEGHRRHLLYSSYNGLHKRMKQSRPCVYPGCPSPSIPRSHTVQRANSLEFISENSHVLTPVLNIETGALGMARVGIRNASTFPGFCSEHEKLFSEYELLGAPREDRHLTQQVFRTICREIVVQEVHLHNIKRNLKAYEVLLSLRGQQFLMDRIGPDVLAEHNIKLKNLTIKGLSWRIEESKKFISQIERTLKRLHGAFLPKSLRDVRGQDDGLAHFVVHIAHPLPVCLAGIGNFHIGIREAPQFVQAILNVIPTQEESIISISVEDKYNDALKSYAALFLCRANGPLTMVETWMVNGTDHWFITPSEWETLSQRRRERILEDMLTNKYSIGQPYPRSILDSVRLSMLQLPEADFAPKDELREEWQKVSDRNVSLSNQNVPGSRNT